jgi:hypothetical protein
MIYRDYSRFKLNVIAQLTLCLVLFVNNMMIHAFLVNFKTTFDSYRQIEHKVHPITSNNQYNPFILNSSKRNGPVVYYLDEDEYEDDEENVDDASVRDGKRNE